MSEKKFSGSFGPKAPKKTDDNLFSTDVVEVILGVSEGPIKGLKDGPKSFFIGDTSLKNVDNQSNFDNFELTFREGSELGEPITPRLGGFSSSTSVNTELATNTTVVRSGTHTDIDYIDVRVAINRLMMQTTKGTFNHTGKFKIEYKASLSPTWLPVRTAATNPLPASSIFTGGVIYAFSNRISTIIASLYDAVSFWQVAAPALSETAAIWFNKNIDNRPQKIVSGVWTNVPNATKSGNTWTWGTSRSTLTETAPTDKKQGDYWLRPSDNAVFFFNGSTWIKAGSSNDAGNFTNSQTVTLTNGEVAITGKTTSTFAKEYRFPVPRLTNDTYQIRITKTTAANDSEKFFDITWESFQEVSSTPMTFPGLATAQLVARASEQFSSIPEFSGVYQGRVIRVPSNYDPVTRIYTGVWDGVWKFAYTNNPAYIVKDLVDNDRYGLNAYYPVVLNDMDVYEAGQWCDTLNLNGQPRFTFNSLISEPRGCREAIEYICGSFAARFFDDGNGTAQIRIDKDGNAARVFTPENVRDGQFVYSWTEVATRYNDITVSFKNPDLQYKEDRRRVFDQANIDKNGRIPLNFVAVGCNSSQEAITRARYKLVTSLTETLIVNFNTNRQGLYLNPYDIILISDDDMQLGKSGRVKSITNSTTFALRDPLFLEAGFNYKAIFTIASGGTVSTVERALAVGVNGTLNSIVLPTGIPAGVTADSVFTISTTTNQNTAKAFRVLSMTENESDPDNVDIQAIEMNRLKWTFIDGLITDLEDPEVIDLNSNGFPEPITNLAARPYTALRGDRETTNITLSWDHSVSKVKAGYQVFMSRDNSEFTSVVDKTTLSSVDILDLLPGEYIFSVVTLGYGRLSSDPVFIEHRLIGDYRDLPVVNNLKMVNGGAGDTFNTPDVSFVWDASPVSTQAKYNVKITTAADVTLREETVYGTEYSYTFAKNNTDTTNVPNRVFKIKVSAIDQYGFTSPEAVLTATNAVPSAPTGVSVAPMLGGVAVFMDPYLDRDFLKVVAHSSTVSGFTPGPSNLIEEADTNNFTLTVATNATRYYRFAFVDIFKGSVINYTNEFTVYSMAVDFSPPPVPTGLALSSNTVVAEGGSVTNLVVTWTASTATDFAYYVVSVRETSGGTAVEYTVNSPRFELRVKPNVAYYVKVKAIDFLANASAFSTELNTTTVRDTTIPAVITGLVVTPGFETMWLRWTRPAELDIAYTDIYESTTTTAPLAGTAATFQTGANTYVRTGLTGAATTRNYWVRAIDTSGNVGPWSAMASGTTTIVDTTITTAKLLGLIDATSFVSGVEPVTASAAGSLPTTKSTNVITWSGSLYRWNGTAYTKSVTAPDITGAIIGSQIATATINTLNLADAAITNAKLGALSVDAGKIIDGSIINSKLGALAVDAAKLALGAVTETKIADDAISTPKLKVGSVIADRIGVNAIIASKILVSDFTNMVPDSSFQDPDAWTFSSGAVAGASFIASPVGVNTDRVIRWQEELTGGGASAFRGDIYPMYLPVVAGATYGFSYSRLFSSLSDGTFDVRVVFYDRLKATIAGGTPIGGVVGTPTLAEAVLTDQKVAPPTAAFARLQIRKAYSASGVITGTSYIYNVSMRRAASAELIVDGSIIADKLATNSVATIHLQAGSITASKLVLADTNNIYPDFDMQDMTLYQSSTGATVTQVATSTSSLGQAYIQAAPVNAAINNSVETGWFAIETLADYLISGLVWNSSSAGGVTTTQYLEIEFGSLGTTGIITPTRRVEVNRLVNGTFGSALLTPIKLTATATERRARFVATRVAGGTAAGTMRFGGLRVQRRSNANLIVEGAITAEKLVIGLAASNLIVNPTAETGNVEAWTVIENSATYPPLQIDPTNGYAGSAAFKAGVVAGNIAYGSRAFPVVPGRTYAVKVAVKATAATATGLYIRMSYLTTKPVTGYIGASSVPTVDTRTSYNDLQSNGPVSDIYQLKEYVWTAPALAQWASLGLYRWTAMGTNILYFDVAEVREQVSSVAIQDGAVVADKIAAGSILVKHLTVGDWTNLIPDSAFTDISTWNQTVGTWSIVNNAQSSGRISLRAPSSGTVEASISSGPFSVEANAPYAFGGVIDITTGSTPAATINIDFYDRLDALISSTTVTRLSTDTSAATKSYVGQGVAPATAVFGRVRVTRVPVSGAISGTMDIFSLYARRASSGELIVDGTIKANHIATGTITTNEIMANTIVAANVAIGGLTADRFAANTITVNQMAANSIGATQLIAGSIAAVHLSTGELITLSAQIKDAIITNAKIVELDAAKITAGSVLTPSVIVSGTTLGTIATRAQARSPSLGLKINYQNFTTANDDEMYIHGFDVDGNPADIDGWVNYNGAKVVVPKQPIFCVDNNAVEGWLAFATASTPFLISATNYAVALVKVVAGVWSYDNNSTWVVFTPTADMVIIGSISKSASTIVSGTVWQEPQTFGSISDSMANDPASLINALSTTILPGKILISGSTTLASWQNGTDVTKIEGGAIATNTIDANKVNIGIRGISISGLSFEANRTTVGGSVVANRAAWNAGTITYTNDAGTVTTAAISAGSTAVWSSGVIYIYWVQAGTTLLSTTTAATARAANNVVLATYAGGVLLTVNYGRTIIDGSSITTGTITATQILAGTITGSLIAGTTITGANIAAATITGTNIAAATIVTGNLAAGSVQAANIAAGAIVAGKLSVGSIDTANLMLDGVVITNKIANNAVTITFSGISPSVVYLPNTFPGDGAVNIVTVPTTVSEGSILLMGFATALMVSPSGYNAGCQLIIYRNGTAIASIFGQSAPTGGSIVTNIALFFQDNSPGVNPTYILQLYGTSYVGGTGYSRAYAGATLIAMNTKR